MSKRQPSTKALSDLLPQGTPKTRRARQAAKADRPLKVVPPADEPVSRFHVVKDGRNWFVHDAQLGRLGEVGSFKTKGAAEAEAITCQRDFDTAKSSAVSSDFPGLADAIKKAADTEGKTEVKPGPGKLGALAPVGLPGTTNADAVSYTPEVIAAMSRTERLVAAKAEMEALRTWRNDGRPVKPGDGPATPVLDWMTDPASKPAATRSTKAAARTPEQEARLAAVIAEGRQCDPPQSWAKIATTIEAEGIPTNRGGKWYDTTVSDLAKKLALV